MATLKTLDRGLQALWIIARAPQGIAIADLATTLGADRAIAYRVAATLIDHGLATRQPDGRLMLGAAVLDLERHFAPQFRDKARPLINQLAADTQATAFLSIAEQDMATAILVSEPEQMMIRVGYRTASSHPLTTGAAGLAILAGRPPSKSDTPEIIQARIDGYSVTRGQLQAGAIGVACPIPAPGLDAAVGVVAMEDLQTNQAIDHVKACAKALAARVR